MENTNIKQLILFVFLLVSFNCYSQFTFNQLTIFAHKSYDEVDELLSKKGFEFEGTMELREDNSSISTWQNKSLERLGIQATPDTITLVWEGRYSGYTDVIRKKVHYMFRNPQYYSSLLSEIKKLKSTKYTYTEDANIISIYDTELYHITIKKQHTKIGINYFITIEAKSLEIGEKHFSFPDL